MEKTFRIYNRLLHFVFVLIWGSLLIAVIYYRTIDGFKNAYNVFESLTVLIFIVFGFVSNLSVFTYKFVVKENEVFDKDIFHKLRHLAINEVEYIRPRAYSGNISRYIYGYKIPGTRDIFVEAPAFTNEKFTKFPRYRISKDIVKFMHNYHPEVRIDVNYSDLIKP